MILMIDNYDSFTYNLVQYLSEMGLEIKVFRNDEISVSSALALQPACIVISPGPGKPSDAGISKELIKAAMGKIPILGVCLGHQAIAEVFSAKIIKAKQIMHGKVSPVFHDGKGVFSLIKSPLKATRYHSLAVDKESLPDCLEISAYTEDGEIMGLRHKEYKVMGIQFHPESILTPTGKRILANFISLAQQESEVA